MSDLGLEGTNPLARFPEFWEFPLSRGSAKPVLFSEIMVYTSPLMAGDRKWWFGFQQVPSLILLSELQDLFLGGVFCTGILLHLSTLLSGQGSVYTSTGLMVSSKLPRFSDMYTLTIASADSKSISAKPTVEFTKSVTKWFTKDGVLVEGLFWKDVEGLINDYANAKDKKSK
ncbi:hypothetical protein L6452_14424 [Arctium lappa]|uniref:Uncharacterized protein n=1 Tax=Arctium lappa TaxID=4217 RepID=A0ACB9CKZ2_ARCLA|nr:hypothetical protein L6452_14424 [Arctium lappa]